MSDTGHTIPQALPDTDPRVDDIDVPVPDNSARPSTHELVLALAERLGRVEAALLAALAVRQGEVREMLRIDRIVTHLDEHPRPRICQDGFSRAATDLLRVVESD